MRIPEIASLTVVLLPFRGDATNLLRNTALARYTRSQYAKFLEAAALRTNLRYLASLASGASAITRLTRYAYFPALCFCFHAVIAVLLLAVLVPPFENSDEFNHMKRAEQVSTGVLLATRYAGPQTSGGLADTGIDRVDSIIGVVRFHPERKVSGEMLRQAGSVRWGTRAQITFANTAIYAPFLYVPAAMATFAGRHAGISISRTLIVARVVSGLTCILAATVAMAFAEEAALLLMTVLSLPMCFSLFGAVSQDGPMLALSTVAVALVFRFNKSDAGKRYVYFVGLCVTLGLLCLGRPPYAPLATLPFLVSARSWRYWRTAIMISLLPLAIWTIVVSRVTMINTEVGRGVRPWLQLTALIRHPDRILGLAWHSVTDKQGMEGLPFYKEFIGVLGWLDVVLPAWFYFYALLILSLATLVSLPSSRPLLSAPARLCLSLAVLAAIVAIFLFQYLTWTTVNLTWVEGVQGRYFLPIALFVPCLLPVLNNRLLLRFRNVIRVLVLTFPTVSLVIMVISVVRRYYV